MEQNKKPCKYFNGLQCLSPNECCEHNCIGGSSLSSSFESSPIGEAFLGADGNFFLVNNAFADLLGYEISELKKMNYKDINHEEDILKCGPQAQAVLRREIPSYNIEKRYIKKNGEVIWVHAYINAIFDENQNFQHFVVHAININERKLQELLTKFVSESGAIGIWVWNDRTKELQWNIEMYKIFGLDPKTEISYETWASRLHPEDKKRAEINFKKSIDENKDFDSYFRIIVNGKTKYIRAKARVQDENLGIVTGTSIDITDFKATREKVKKNNEELEYFTYAVSHDLKSPLVTLSGFSSLISHVLQQGEEGDKEVIAEAAKEIQKATKNLSSTIDSILHLSRIGRIYMEKNFVNTEDIVEEIIALNAVKINNGNVTISNHSNMNVFVQREIFSSIMQNLLTNSLDHAQKEHEKLNIEINFQGHNDKDFYIIYKDNGLGMTQKQIDNLFNYSSREFAKGFGMMIIKKGIDYHHGEIEIKSEPNNGTEFRILIRQ